MVAVQERRLPSASGKAEMPGVVDIMSCMSSVCSLGGVLARRRVGDPGDGFQAAVQQVGQLDVTYLLVTLWLSCLREPEDNFVASCMV